MVFFPDRGIEPQRLEINFNAKFLALGIFSGLISLMLAATAFFSFNLAYDQDFQPNFRQNFALIIGSILTALAGWWQKCKPQINDNEVLWVRLCINYGPILPAFLFLLGSANSEWTMSAFMKVLNYLQSMIEENEIIQVLSAVFNKFGQLGREEAEAIVEEPADEEPLLDPLELRPRGLPMIANEEFEEEDDEDDPDWEP